MATSKTKVDVKTINSEILRIREYFKHENTFHSGIDSFLNLHSLFFEGTVSGANLPTYEDKLWEGLSDHQARRALNSKNSTIVFALWHTARIEDITMNILINNDQQVFVVGGHFQKINSGIFDTGNSLSKEKIYAMSESCDLPSLRRYRIEVGTKTRQIVAGLKFDDLKRKPQKPHLERILREQAVSMDAKWLVDFWANKSFEGLLMMPACRHHVVHMNRNFEAKFSNRFSTQ